MVKFIKITDNRTRYRFAFRCFLIIMATAWAKHWFPGISETLVIAGAVPVISYILGETLRPSSREGSSESHDKIGATLP